MRKKQQPGNQQKNTLTPRYQVLHPKLPDLAELTIIAERARREGFIAIQDISMILSSDEGYNDLLPAMWEEYQISIRRKFPDDISAPESRFGVWYALFERWTMGTVSAVRGGLRLINLLRAHTYDSVQRDHVAVDVTDKDPDYVMLDELKSYFTDYIKLPLPTLIFHPDKEQPQESTARTSKNQLLKEQVRAAADKLWKKDPSITKADMALHDDINSIPGASELTEQTLGGWIKDLNPNRRPGRRPKQT